MRAFGLINLGVLPLLLEAMVPAYAQHDQREREAKRPNQEQSAKPEKERQQARPTRQQAPERSKRQQAARPEKSQPQARPARQEKQPQAREQRAERPSNLRGQPGQPQREQQRLQQAKRPTPAVQRRREVEHRTVWQGHRAHNWQAEHRSWQDRGGYKGYRIPEASYRGHFGPEFGFRMFSFPLVVVGGFPRFQYGGFWFSVMDPWPEYWSDDWYGNDDMYIDYWDGGYYLHNRRHPMDRIAITVYVN